MTSALSSFVAWPLPGGSGLKTVIVWVPSPNPHLCPGDLRLCWTSRAALKEKRRTKVIPCNLKGRRRERVRLFYQLGLGLLICIFTVQSNKSCSAGHSGKSYPLATPNSFRSFLGDISTTFILEDWIPRPAVSLPIIFHPGEAMNGRPPHEQYVPRMIKHSCIEKSYKLKIDIA